MPASSIKYGFRTRWRWQSLRRYLPATKELDQTKDEFRLFRLRKNVLELDLTVFRLQDCPSYVALSYIWYVALGLDHDIRTN
jgi:hypothetical protein